MVGSPQGSTQFYKKVGVSQRKYLKYLLEALYVLSLSNQI